MASLTHIEQFIYYRPNLLDKKVDLKIILSKKIQTFHKNNYRIGLEKKVFSGIRYTFWN